MNNDNAIEAIKSLPAVSVSSLILFGVPLSEWVFIGTLILVVLQIIAIVRDKFYKPWKDRNDRR